MKLCRGALAALVVVVACGLPAISQGQDLESVFYGNRQVILDSLLQRLATCPAPERERAAFLLGEGRFTEAVIPLMQMLHTCPTREGRMVAALALSRINEGRGTYAVLQAARFDADPQVRLVCGWYYNEYVQPGSFSFEPANHPVAAVENIRK